MADPKIRYDIEANATGAASVEQLASELGKLDKSIDPAAAQRAQALAAQLRELGAQQTAIGRFVELKTSVQDAKGALDQAQAAAQKLGAELAAVEKPTRAQSGQMQKLRDDVRAAKGAYQEQVTQLQASRAALSGAGVDTNNLVAAQQRLKAQSAQVADIAQRTAAAYRDQGKEAQASATQQATAHRQIAGGVTSISDSLNNLKNLSIAGILGSQTAQLLKSVSETSDEYLNLASRIKLVTGEGAAFQQAFDGVFEVAKRTNSSLESTGTLFARIAQAGKEVGLSQRDALALTESINQAVQLSGGSAQAADAAVTQLIQGLQSGVLRGQEFNSVMEQAPRLAQALAAGLGVTTGALRNMANEGKLTSTTVIQALQSQRAVLERDFATLPATVGRAIQNLSTEWTRFVGQLSQGSGATQAVADGINVLAGNLDNIAAVAERAGVVLVAALAVQAVGALKAYSLEAAAAAGNTNLLALSMDKVPKTVNIVIAAVGFEIGFQLGEMLYKNSELARKLGIGITAFFENVVNDLRFLKDAAEAVFTSDTIDAAFDRYRDRGRELDAIFKDLWEGAEQAPTRVASAAADATQATQGLGQAGQAAGAQIAAGAAGAASATQGAGRAAESAQGAFEELAKKAGVSLPSVNVTIGQTAAQLTQVVLKGGEAARVVGAELPAAIAKLSGPELDKFRAGLVGALEESIRASQRMAEQGGSASRSLEQALHDAEAAGRLLDQVMVQIGVRAAQSLGVDTVAASDRVGESLRAAEADLSILIRSMPRLQAAGVDAAAVVSQALAKMIDGARNQAEIDAIIGKANALGAAGQLAGGQVSAVLEIAAKKARDLKIAFDEATPGIQSLGEAAKRVGADIDELTGGVSKGLRDNVQDIDAFVAQLDKAGISAERAGPALTKALDQQIAAANTREELELVAAVIDKVGTSAAGAEVNTTGMLERVRQKAEQLTPAMQQLAGAAELLGVKIGTSTRVGVEQAALAYERLKASGKLTAEELQTAFVNSARKQIEANQGVVPEWVKVEAAARGVRIEVDATGKATVAAMGAATGAVKDLGYAFMGATAEAQALKAAAEEAAKAAKSARDNAELGANATEFFNSPTQSLIRKRDAGTLSAGDLSAAEQAFEVAKNNLTSAQAAGSAISFQGRRGIEADYNEARRVLDAVKSIVAMANAPTSGSGSITVPASAPVSGTRSTGSGNVNVTLNFGGQSATLTGTQSQADAFLRLLEEAKRSAGG